MNTDTELDAKGLSCPMPIVKLAKQMKSMETGQVLKLVADDPGSQEDVPAWCRRTGNDLVETSTEGQNFIYLIRKN